MYDQESAMLSIIAAWCQADCANEPDLNTRIKKAMKPVIESFWMGGNEDTRFRGALFAVYLDPLTTQEEKDRMKFSLDKMRALGAMFTGIPVSIDALAANPDDIKPIPLGILWNKVKEENNVSNGR